MKRKILVVSHCFLNDSANLNFQNPDEENEERAKKRKILLTLLEKDIDLVQLPCPELAFYGSSRWGHTSEQFDTPFFREESRKLLAPVIRDLREYNAHPERFEILGILGINGSPSCGVDFTCSGNYGGDLHDIQNQSDRLKVTTKPEPGIFMQELFNLLDEFQISCPHYSI